MTGWEDHMTLIEATRSAVGYPGRPTPTGCPHAWRRPGPARPRVAPPRYRGTGVWMSTAPHHRRPIRPATTVGLALLAAMITLWLGVVAHFGEAVDGAAGKAGPMPARLAVVRVDAGETLPHLAARVAPDAPVGQVIQRIRELNDLQSPTLTAGQTLIAPVG
ncbi:LysM peptidoglycan-binding domain-containing protein [Mycobacterium heckeshornense]|nr:LysM peptidoglycan-binding domain-containing protein [Mycobacterium heckeshornense]MCV7034750.1 LysM peptidoglycan-binding domain-containing protein [Mycobacterium heckeshornense]